MHSCYEWPSALYVCSCMYDMMYVYVHRKMNIFLVCDRNVEIDNPDFQFDGEKEGYVYVSMYVHMLVQYGFSVH